MVLINQISGPPHQNWTRLPAIARAGWKACWVAISLLFYCFIADYGDLPAATSYVAMHTLVSYKPFARQAVKFTR